MPGSKKAESANASGRGYGVGSGLLFPIVSAAVMGGHYMLQLYNEMI